MKLREEEDGEAALLAMQLECGFDRGKIWLAEKEAAAATVNAIFRTLEILALGI